MIWITHFSHEKTMTTNLTNTPTENSGLIFGIGRSDVINPRHFIFEFCEYVFGG